MNNQIKVNNSSIFNKANTWQIVIIIILFSSIFSGFMAFFLNSFIAFVFYNLAIDLVIPASLYPVLTLSSLSIASILLSILWYYILAVAVVKGGSYLEKNAPKKIANIIVIYCAIVLVYGIIEFFTKINSDSDFYINLSDFAIIVNICIMVIGFGLKTLFVKNIVKNKLNKCVID